MRGKHVTKPIEEVIREARELAADGVRELIIVAQDTTYYGLDLYGRVRLAELLRELDQVDGIEWIRILYAYPIHFTDELIETLADAQKIMPYLDMPLQHINDRVLQAHAAARQPGRDRGVAGASCAQAIPNLTLRTTFIVGFPGETEAEFEELCDFVAATRVRARRRLPLFASSRARRRRGSTAICPKRSKQERRDRLMEMQQEIAFAWSAAQVGKELEVIVDGARPGGARPRAGPRPRRRPGHRLRGARQGQGPAARRPGAAQGHRGRRLRPGRPGAQIR